ncbi:hypothetical protein RZS28_06145 [Methylocapsa polymorpha]|uniref:Uncharacterized protein n=1 Tax=Methylocapsa polymorpha TaxID=3080828 RepID=A0ABZ0HVR4_9HYPH|nr:hypothetical protein RZS28_06145 [Methylocapsa sp. RX1]
MAAGNHQIEGASDVLVIGDVRTWRRVSKLPHGAVGRGYVRSLDAYG